MHCFNMGIFKIVILKVFLICFIVCDTSQFLIGPNEYQHSEHLSRNVTTAVSMDAICCTHGRWEANAFLIAGATFSMNNETVYFFYNGTGYVAFDEANQRAYVNYNLTASTPILPVQYHLQTTKIYDFAKGLEYEIDEHGKCTKEISQETLQIVCVPQHAKQVSQGVFGNMTVSTYQFSAKDIIEQITTVTVLQNGSYCETVSLSFAFFSDLGGTVYDLDVVDMSQGIHDPSVLVIPKSCDTLR